MQNGSMTSNHSSLKETICSVADVAFHDFLTDLFEKGKGNLNSNKQKKTNIESFLFIELLLSVCWSVGWLVGRSAIIS